MTRDDIIKLAYAAKLPIGWINIGVVSWFDLERFAALVAAAEREACAKVCDVTPPHPFRPSIEAAHAIRARSKT